MSTENDVKYGNNGVWVFLRRAAGKDTARKDVTGKDAAGAKRGTVDESGLVVYYDDQCPFLPARVETLRAYCEEKGIRADFRRVGSLTEAKALPSVFNNFATFWNGQLVTVNQIDPKMLEKIIGRSGS